MHLDPLSCCQVVSRQMVARGQGGSIVNVSSVASLRGLPDHAAYCASKAAVDKLTGVMALELGKHKVKGDGWHISTIIIE